MKLTNISVENFRCYQSVFSVSISDFTAIIGKNDVGKSTILEALDIFLGNAKLEKLDVSVNGDPKAVRICCEFSDLPNQLIIDADNPTSLHAEHLLNEVGRLVVEKTFNLEGATSKLTSVVAVSLHPTKIGYNDLLTLKRVDLLKRAAELNVDLEGVNKAINAEIRRAIWANAVDLEKQMVKVDLLSETGRKAWDAIEKYLPRFWLFRSDRASTDQDAEAQDPLTAAISEAIKSIEGKLRDVTEHVENEVKKVAEATLQKLAEMDPDLSATLNPVIRTKKWDSLFQTSITGDDGIPLNKRGSGVRRLILLSFFRAQVERILDANGDSSVIYAIEEPETSQHPRNQRLIISTLRQLAADRSRQVIITTHSPMLARTLPDQDIRFIHKNGPNRAIAVGGGEVNSGIAEALGVLPDNSVRVFIGVEGPNDIAFFQGISKAIADDVEGVSDLEKLEIDGKVIFIPLGGSCLLQWSERLAPLMRHEIHICDRDYAPPLEAKYNAHVIAVNARPNCAAYNTSKRELENYIHPASIANFYRSQGQEIVLPDRFDDFSDVPAIVAEALQVAAGGQDWNNLPLDAKKRKMSMVKRNINYHAVREMNADLLGQIDEHGDVIGWLREITLQANQAI